MTRKHNRKGSSQRDSARSRALLGTAIGLCLAVPPVEAGPASRILDFTARAEGGAVLLTWTLPPITTFSRLVIRFQVDGPAPSSPHAGSPLLDEPTLPGAMYGRRHTNLSPQHTYSYAAFALDASGVVRASTTAVSSPSTLRPPGTVQNLRPAAPADGGAR
jgi:hypothetical protein